MSSKQSHMWVTAYRMPTLPPAVLPSSSCRLPLFPLLTSLGGDLGKDLDPKNSFCWRQTAFTPHWVKGILSWTIIWWGTNHLNPLCLWNSDRNSSKCPDSETEMTLRMGPLRLPSLGLLTSVYFSKLVSIQRKSSNINLQREESILERYQYNEWDLCTTWNFNIFYFLNSLCLLCVVCSHVCKYTQVMKCLWRPEEGLGSPGNGVRAGVSHHVDSGN